MSWLALHTVSRGPSRALRLFGLVTSLITEMTVLCDWRHKRYWCGPTVESIIRSCHHRNIFRDGCYPCLWTYATNEWTKSLGKDAILSHAHHRNDGALWLALHALLHGAWTNRRNKSQKSSSQKIISWRTLFMCVHIRPQTSQTFGKTSPLTYQFIVESPQKSHRFVIHEFFWFLKKHPVVQVMLSQNWWHHTLRDWRYMSD